MLKRTALGLAVVAALTACGGGGGGGHSDGGDGGGNPSTKAAGTASKGIIAGALVEARKANGELIGSATTAEDGSYSIDLSGYSGPVKLTLKPRDGALVTCDVASCRPASAADNDADNDGTIEFGEQYALDYELRSVVYADSTASTVSSHITPLTTLVADKAGDAPDQAGIAVANSFVKGLLGLTSNPSEVAPVDLTKTDKASLEQLQYSLLNAAVEQQAQGSSVKDVLDSLAENFSSNSVNKSALDGLVSSIDAVKTAVLSGNEGLGQVEAAAANVESDAQDAIDAACGEDETPQAQTRIAAVEEQSQEDKACTPEIELDGDIGSNLEKAKALVATARKVSIEAVDAINNELDEDSDDYNPDNLIVKITGLADDVDTDTRKTVQAFGDVAAVLTDQIVRVELDGAEGPTADLNEASGEYYDASFEAGCEYYPEQTQAACEADAQSQKEDFMSHFVGGTVTKDGQEWAVSGGVFDLDGNDQTTDDQVSVDLAVTVPTVLHGEGEEDLGLGAGESSLSISGEATKGDFIKLTVVEGSRFQVDLNDPFINTEESETGASIKSASLKLDAVLENADFKFSGGIDAVVVESDKQGQLNNAGAVELLMPIPRKFVMNGEFVEKGTQKVLDADLTLTIDNADSFGFYQEGLERNDLASYQYDSDNNTLTLTAGSGGDKVVVVYSLSIHNNRGWVYYQINASCSAMGNAACPSPEWSVDFNGRAQLVEDDTTKEECFNDSRYTYIWWEDGECLYWQEAEDTGVDDDIRVAFTGDAGELAMGDISLRIPGEGLYGVGPENWWEDYNTVSITPEANGSIVSHLSESTLDFDAQGRYLKGNLLVKTHGKLSANLPEMDVNLNATRTGYELGEASLTLKWGADSLTINYPYSGVNSRTATLTDGAGTVMSVTFDDSEDSVTGDISKDGTVYGTFREENGQYIISWIDNTIESLY